MFSGKTLLVTGGTGSFGNAVLRKVLTTDASPSSIFWSFSPTIDSEQSNTKKTGSLRIPISPFLDVSFSLPWL